MSKLFGRVRKLLEMADEKGLTEGGADALVQTGLWSDLCEVVGLDKLKTVDREAFRNFLGLSSLTPSILELVQELDCPATKEFELNDFFTVDNLIVKFGWIDLDMTKYFGNQSIPAEGPRKLVVSKLARNAKEKELLARVAHVRFVLNGCNPERCYGKHETSECDRAEFSRNLQRNSSNSLKERRVPC